MAAVACLILRKYSGGLRGRDRSVLEPALGKDGHLEFEHRANAARDDLPLQGVQSLVRPFSQLGERNRLGNCDYGRTSVGTETVESVFARARVASDTPAAIAARVGERVFDGVDAPSFLIEHPVVDDAPDRELAVLLDRIVLEVLIAAITVDEQQPIRIALANPGEQR